MNKFDFIILLSTPWSKYHRKPYLFEIAKALQKGSGKILLIEPQISPLATLILHFNRFFKYFTTKKIKHIRENVYLFTPFALFHFYIAGYFKILARINNYFIRHQVTKACSDLDLANKRLLWVFRPECLNQYLNTADENMVVYDYYDDYRIDFNGKVNKRNTDLEKQLLKKTDFVFCTSSKLLKQAQEVNTNAHLIENAAPIDIFLKVKDPSIEIDSRILNLKKPVIGYHGNVRNWIDFELVEYLLKNSDYTFVFAGAVNKNAQKMVSKLSTYSNFITTGRIEYEKFPHIIKGFDVEFIPFKMNSYNESVVPYKLFESLASGKPLVAAALPDIEQRWSEWCHVYHTNQEALAKINEALSDKKKHYPVDNQDMIKKLSWQDRVETLFKILNS